MKGVSCENLLPFLCIIVRIVTIDLRLMKVELKTYSTNNHYTEAAVIIQYTPMRIAIVEEPNDNCFGS